MKFFIRKHHGKITAGSVLSRGGGSLLLQRKPRKVTPANIASSLEDFLSTAREGISAKVQGWPRGSTSFKGHVPSTELPIGSSQTSRPSPPP